MGDGDGTIIIVCKIQSQETGGFAFQGDFVVLADVDDDGVDVCLLVAEDEGVIDVDDDVRCLSRGDAIK